MGSTLIRFPMFTEAVLDLVQQYLAASHRVLAHSDALRTALNG